MLKRTNCFWAKFLRTGLKVTFTKESWHAGSNHLKNLKAHVSNSQIDLGALPVGRWMETDAVHLQFAGNLQDLKIWFGRSLAPETENVTNPWIFMRNSLFSSCCSYNTPAAQVRFWVLSWFALKFHLWLITSLCCSWHGWPYKTEN